MKKIVIVLAVIFLLILIGGISGLVWYNSSLKPISNEENIIRVEIPEGTGVSGIANILKDKKVIKNDLVFKIYCKINNVTNLQAGKYDLNTAEDMPKIIAHIANGEVATDEIKITFIEGKNMRWYAKEIAEKTKNTEDDVFNLLKDEEYIDSLIEKYWFLTDEIKNNDIYYPLEGYLLPDTYIFENDEVTVETIFNVILNYMEKFLEEYKNDFTYTVHNTLTLASMTELEGKSLEDRQEIVGVFWNRISKKMSLGSDVTTYYAFGVDMADRNLTKKEIDTYNPYNTRGPNMSGKLPIGPICNPSKTAIQAAIAPTETDALYFVADKNGKVYFTESNDEHNRKISELKSKDLWYTY